MKHACERISQLASEQLDRPLSLKEKLQLKLHISMCSLCRNYHNSLQTMSNIFKAMRQHDQLDESIKLPDQSRQKIERTLKEHL
ncbi:MAG: zf-HC2 domain-containing protein [Mariprofundaceae bacterium]